MMRLQLSLVSPGEWTKHDRRRTEGTGISGTLRIGFILSPFTVAPFAASNRGASVRSSGPGPELGTGTDYRINERR